MISSFKKKRLNYDFSRKTEELEKGTSFSGLYLDFYNLRKSPFAITPDPEFLFSSSTHKTAIENILYGIEACMGFMLLIGEVGTGKTTLCRAILDKLEGKAETVYIINPSLSGIEIIQAILDDLGLDYPADSSKKVLLDLLNRFLLEVTPEKPVVIIIDDAQTMTQEGLENLRLLSNLETDKKKLLQLVLVGQQELLGQLSQPELRQLKQRITICCQLDLLGYNELKQYISLRLFVAGDNGRFIFSESAIKEIYKASKGIPRLINIICDYALTAGYIYSSPVIKKVHAKRAINELSYQSLVNRTFFSGLFSYVNEKRVRVELLILFIGLLCCVFLYVGKILDKEFQSIFIQEQSKPIDISDLTDSTPGNDVGNTSVNPVVNNREDTSVIKGELTVSENHKDTIIKATENYIVQLSSLKTLEAAIQEGMSLRQRKMDVHWNAVHLIEKGTWYRVYKGGFSTKKEAMDFKKENGITKGIVIYAPWTILVSSRNKQETSEEIYSRLQEKGLDCMLENGGEKNNRALVGAFISNERAQKAAQVILDMGLDAKPVLR